VEHKDTADLAKDEDEEDAAIPLTDNKALWTARVNARSRVRPGQTLELAVDTTRLHFFDPESGLAVGHPEAATVEAVSV
jgi:multiple sugar transport system ATP-binding protein